MVLKINTGNPCYPAGTRDSEIKMLPGSDWRVIPSRRVEEFCATTTRRARSLISTAVLYRYSCTRILCILIALLVASMTMLVRRSSPTLADRPYDVPVRKPTAACTVECRMQNALQKYKVSIQDRPVRGSTRLMLTFAYYNVQYIGTVQYRAGVS